MELAVNAALTTGGNLDIDLGVGNDVVDEDGRDLTIKGNLIFRGVNSFENDGTMLVVGNATAKSHFETQTTQFDDDASMTILGNFNFTGGNGRDEVLLNGAAGTWIGGNVKIDLRGNTVGGTQFGLFQRTSRHGRRPSQSYVQQQQLPRQLLESSRRDFRR